MSVTAAWFTAGDTGLIFFHPLTEGRVIFWMIWCSVW